MKKITLLLSFIIVFLLGIIIGFGVSRVSSKQTEKPVLASNPDIDFKELATEDATGSVEETQPASEEVQPSEVINETTETEEAETEESESEDEEDEEDQETSDAPYLGDFDKTQCAKLNQEREALYAQPDSYSNTMAIADIDKQIVDLNTYNFANKKVAFLGDSITVGYGGNVIGQDKYFGFDEYMQEMLNIGEIVNVGSGGSTIGRYNDDSCFERRGKDDIEDDVDIIIVMGGINDFINGWKYFGDMDHLDKEETYCGSVDTLFYTLHNRWNADVFVVTPYRLELEQEGADKGIEFVKYIDVQRDLYERYHLNLFDLYETGFLNTNIPEIKANLSADGTHLNNEGYKLLGQHIAADLVTYYGNKQYR